MSIVALNGYEDIEPCLREFAHCLAQHLKLLEQKPATHCAEEPYCYLVRSLPNCQHRKPDELRIAIALRTGAKFFESM